MKTHDGFSTAGPSAVALPLQSKSSRWFACISASAHQCLGLAILLMVGLLGACFDEGWKITAIGSVDEAVTLTLDDTTETRVYEGQTKRLGITVRRGDTVVNPDSVGVVISWRSEDPSIASVDANGLLQGIAEGQTRIVVGSQGWEVAASVTVAPGAQSIEVLNADSLAGVVGEILEGGIRLQVKDRNGGDIGGITVHFQALAGGGTVEPTEVITDSEGWADVQWTLGPLAGEQELDVVAQFAASAAPSPTGEAAPAGASSAPGKGVGRGVKAMAKVAAPKTVTITPGSAQLLTDYDLEFQARIEDKFGNEVTDAALVWFTSDVSIVTVSDVGVAHGVAPGSAEVVASVVGKSVSGSAQVAVVTVLSELTIITTSMPAGTVGMAYSQALTVTGGNGAYAWALFNGPTLPAGLVLNAATGEISGTPTATGTTSFQVEVTSVGQTATKALQITIDAVPPPSAPNITTGSPMPNGTVGVAYSKTLAAAGGDGSYTWALFNATTLPAGLELNTATGAISGTPTAAGTTNFEAEVTSAAQSTTKALRVTIDAAPPPPPPSIATSSPMANGTVGMAYSETLAATGGDGNYTWALFNATTLPSGLTLNTATGLISGLPTALGTTNFEVEVTSAAQNTSRALSITIQGGEPLPDFAQTTNDYLAAFATAGDTRWAAEAGVPAYTRTYYDRSYAWYAFGEAARGDADQQDLMDTYWDPNNGKIPPRQWEPDGLVEHYLRNGDAALLESLRQAATLATSNFINKGWVGGCCWEGRIQERALLITMAADAVGVTQTFDWREQARVVKDAILATQNADGSWTPPSSGYTSVNTGEQVSTNFMSAIAMSSLIRYAEYYDDDVSNIQQTVDDGMEWMWTTQWVSGGGGFKYYSDQTSGGGPGAAPDLNMLFVDVFGWLYYKTGDTKWITRGDEIFQAAVTRASYNYGVKHFNQFFRNSWRYLYYRDGYDISILQNPTEVHR